MRACAAPAFVLLLDVSVYKSFRAAPGRDEYADYFLLICAKINSAHAEHAVKSHNFSQSKKYPKSKDF
jgi:hypothetical protein